MAAMNLVLGLGSNLDDKKENLKKTSELLQKRFTLVESSRVYESKAVDVSDQPDFYNKVVHLLVTEELSAVQILNFCQFVEKEMGRKKDRNKGPRIIDIDILFLDEQIIQTPKLQIPHPSWKERSFVVRPLMELAIWKKLRRNFPLPSKIEFQIDAFPLK